MANNQHAIEETGLSVPDKYAVGLSRREANFTPLSPVSFVRRTAEAYPDAIAIVFDGRTVTWAETYGRCLQLAGALRQAGVGTGSTVSVLCRNLPAAVELSYAVPMSRGVLNMINTRLDPAGIAFILDFGEAEIFFVDTGLGNVALKALELSRRKPRVVFIQDPSAPAPDGVDAIEYEAFVVTGAPLDGDDIGPHDEWDAIALNFTSGTTGNPKGVVYHHRGAYLASLGDALEWSMPRHPRYLWTLPLFHCNGWCFPWALAERAGTHVCLRAPVAADILDAIEIHGVTHMCGAPIVLNMATTEAEARGVAISPRVRMMTAGAAPPSAVLARAEAAGFDVTHVYGLTEVYGPATVCAWRDEWDELEADERARYKARQGVNYSVLEELSVRDPETLEPVPADGETIGEVMFRGNVVMKGYLKNEAATEAALAGGHFLSGDLAVLHPDGHIELKDRSKDIIISGGENISSIEVESVIYRHPAVSEAAVVAGSHEKWGETPVAFVELKSGAQLSERELIDFCRARLSHFMCPTRVVFEALPKTSTGKIQKFELRRRAAEQG